MAELGKQIQEAVSRVRVEWDDEHAANLERGLRERGRRQVRNRRLAAVAGAVVVALVIAGGLVKQPWRSELAGTPQRGTELRLADGSRVELLDGQTEIKPTLSEPTEVVLELTRGAARFDVTPNSTRTFRVVCGSWKVEVLGTIFRVEREPAGIFVAVEKGRVRVSGAGQRAELSSGEARHFSAEPPPTSEPAQAPAEVRTQPPPTGVKDAGGFERQSSWRELAEQGEYAKSYELLGRSEPRDDPEELLLAADVARLSGHPGQAVAPLRRLVARHRGNPRAPLAAFTLGRVLLDELGRPREAAEAFAMVGTLDRSSQLAEDALAREVEALSRAGDSSAAHRRAEQYVRLYPAGRKIKAVRRHGGLDEY
jgi:transmembrane sensor